VDGFRGLEVYSRAVAFADALHFATQGWVWTDRRDIGSQMLRAADSVGANIAEACGRGTYADRRRQLFVARGSAFELEHWVERAQARHFDLPLNAQSEARRISRMLNGLIARWSQRPMTEDRGPRTPTRPTSVETP
jgi:four helix bundle protein